MVKIILAEFKGNYECSTFLNIKSIHAVFLGAKCKQCLTLEAILLKVAKNTIVPSHRLRTKYCKMLQGGKYSSLTFI